MGVPEVGSQLAPNDEIPPHVVAEQLELVRAIGVQNAGNILSGQQAVGVGEIEHRADIGIVLTVVAAEVALVVAIQLGQHVASIELNIREAFADDELASIYRCGYGFGKPSAMPSEPIGFVVPFANAV